MNISAILICATVTVFAFAIGEAIAPSLIEGVKNILLSPFVLVSDVYRNRSDLLRFLVAVFWWIVAIAVLVMIVAVFHISF